MCMCTSVIVLYVRMYASLVCCVYVCVCVFVCVCVLQTFNELLKPHMNEAEMMAMVAKSEEFEQVKVSKSSVISTSI